MGVIFKKGHIIPRWCHVKTDDRKAQHNCIFGCDVEVTVFGGVAKIVALSVPVQNYEPGVRYALPDPCVTYCLPAGYGELSSFAEIGGRG